MMTADTAARRRALSRVSIAVLSPVSTDWEKNSRTARRGNTVGAGGRWCEHGGDSTVSDGGRVESALVSWISDQSSNGLCRYSLCSNDSVSNAVISNAVSRYVGCVAGIVSRGWKR